jgi:hypothetical protein
MAYGAIREFGELLRTEELEHLCVGGVTVHMDTTGQTENVKAVVAGERLRSTWIGILVHCEHLREGEKNTFSHQPSIPQQESGCWSPDYIS